MNKESIQIKFEGQGHQIDANTLVNTLIHYSALINEVNKLYGDDTRNINIRINAIEKGSFVIDIELVEKLISKLFSSDNVNYLAALATVVTSVYTLFKVKKGKKTDVNTTVINNVNIDNKTIVNIYNERIVRETISKSIETADNDVSVEGISITQSNGEVVDFKKQDFGEYINIDFSDEDVLPMEKREIVDDAILGIIKLAFEKGRSWEFIYQGFKISIPMKDASFYEEIKSGARFAMGDQLIVKLEIMQKFNELYNLYENKGYKILEVKKHILVHRPEQIKIDFD